MKKVFIVLAAAAALLCGCDKYGPRLDEIEGRLSALEQKCEELNTNISGIGKIVDALNNNISIKEVKKVDNGFQVVFSDGTSYYITNGPKGDTPGITAALDGDTYYWKVNGEWLTDGAGNKIPVTGATPQLKYDGDTDTWYVSTDKGQTWEVVGVQKTGTDITFTEDDEAYYFDFGDGNVAKISKMATFVLKVESDVVTVEAGKTVTLAYTITGGDETTHVVAEASGYTAKVDEDAKTVAITAGASVEAGWVILKAIRNSDGASSSQFVSVNNGTTPPGPQESIELTITDLTYNSVSYSAVPSDKQMYYLVSLMSKEYMDYYGLDDDDVLFQDDIDYYAQLGQAYGYTLAEVLEILCDQGDSQYTFDDLEPQTEYILYAYGVSLSETPARLTPVARVTFTTPAAPAGGQAYEAMLGDWLFKGTITSSGSTSDWEATINFSEKVKNESFTLTGFYGEYECAANFNSETNVLSIPFGADNPIGRFNFGSIGVKWGCWMGYDGQYVYTRGSFYWRLNEAMNELTSATVDSDTDEIMNPIGITCGVFDVNDDGSVGDWSQYVFGPGQMLFTSMKKVEGGSSAASVKTVRYNTHPEKKLVGKTESAEKCMLIVK